MNSVRFQERAFGSFRRAGNNENAFFTAMYLCLGYDMTFGNFSASRGWLAKRVESSRTPASTPLEGGYCCAKQ